MRRKSKVRCNGKISGVYLDQMACLTRALARAKRETALSILFAICAVSILL